MIRTTAGVLALSAFLVVAGCSSDAADTDQSATEEVAVSSEPAATQAAPALSDAEIAHIAVTANTVDADLGRFAAERAESQAVRDFAETMVTDHTAVNASASELVQRLGVTPVANPVSESLAQGGDEAHAQLEGLTGAAFDRAYIDREVAYHQAVLDALDSTLIPGATNAELKSLLEGVRPAISAHLERARGIQTDLASAQ